MYKSTAGTLIILISTMRQKNDLILNVGHIMESFVDRAFGCDSVQLALQQSNGSADVVSGNALSSIAKDAFDGSPVIELEANEVSTKFNNVKGENVKS